MDAKSRLFIAAGIVVALLVTVITIISVLNIKPLDITGRYVLKMDGKYIETYLTVTSHGEEFFFSIENSDGLKAQYASKKLLSGDYTFADYSGDNKITEYRLKAHSDRLEGSVNLLPLGKVNIVFEKLVPENGKIR